MIQIVRRKHLLFSSFKINACCHCRVDSGLAFIWLIFVQSFVIYCNESWYATCQNMDKTTQMLFLKFVENRDKINFRNVKVVCATFT